MTLIRHVSLLAVCFFQPVLCIAQDKSLRNFIDTEISAAWKKENITPAPIASDTAFLRRIYLDLVGDVPTYDETKRFLDDNDPQKREKLVDRLLDDPRFATHQADIWDLLLFTRSPLNANATRERDGFKKWLTEEFAKNVPYDRLVYELLTATNGGAQMFLVQYRNQTEEATVAVTRKFLGTQLQCARCHDHPYEPWTQKDFFGMAGFLTRLVVLDRGGKNDDRYWLGEKSTGDVMFTGSVKEQKPGQKGTPVKPKYLGGDQLDEPPLPKKFEEPDWRKVKTPPKPMFSRREKLAEWITSRENPYFAKAATNRIWSHLMGRGLVQPVDDLSPTKAASHPRLFEELAKQFLSHKFDLKWLIREIVNSDAYQLAGTGDVTSTAPRFYQRARVRPLSAEEMIATLRTATGFDDAVRASGKDPQKERMPSNFDSYIVRYMGKPTDGRGDFQGSLNEHLMFNNSSHLRAMINQRKGNLADWMLTSKASWSEKVDRMYLTVLTRLPRPAERDRFVAFLSGDGEERDLVQDAIWVLLNTAEFRFNH